MKVLHDRVSRRTGTRTSVKRAGPARPYVVACEHGEKMEFATLNPALHAAKYSDEWCDSCADGAPEVQPLRPARLEWDERKMARRLVDVATGAVIASGIYSAINLHSIVRAEKLALEIVPLVEPDEPDLDWNDRAACKGMPGRVFFEEAWQPGPGHRSKGFEAARAVCFTCPVRAECRDDSLASPPAHRLGVRGGYDPAELEAIEADRPSGPPEVGEA